MNQNASKMTQKLKNAGKSHLAPQFIAYGPNQSPEHTPELEFLIRGPLSGDALDCHAHFQKVYDGSEEQCKVVLAGAVNTVIASAKEFKTFTGFWPALTHPDFVRFTDDLKQAGFFHSPVPSWKCEFHWTICHCQFLTFALL